MYYSPPFAVQMAHYGGSNENVNLQRINSRPCFTCFSLPPYLRFILSHSGNRYIYSLHNDVSVHDYIIYSTARCVESPIPLVYRCSVSGSIIPLVVYSRCSVSGVNMLQLHGCVKLICWVNSFYYFRYRRCLWGCIAGACGVASGILKIFVFVQLPWLVLLIWPMIIIIFTEGCNICCVRCSMSGVNCLSVVCHCSTHARYLSC